MNKINLLFWQGNAIQMWNCSVIQTSPTFVEPKPLPFRYSSGW